MRKKVIAVIGNKKIDRDGIRWRLAFETGKILVDNGYRVQSGGLGGVMEAVFAGAHASEKYREGARGRTFAQLVEQRALYSSMMHYESEYLSVYQQA